MSSIMRWLVTVVGAVIAGLIVNWVWGHLQPPSREPSIINNYYLPSSPAAGSYEAPPADPGMPIEEIPPEPAPTTEPLPDPPPENLG